MKFETTDAAGNANGFLVTIWSALENPELRPDQVYLTVVAPHSVKGPHLHMKRRGLFCCIAGAVRIVTRKGKFYISNLLAEGNDSFQVPPGTAAAIYNDSDEPAYVLNMPSPAWSAEDPDEHPVENWDYRP